MPDHETLPPHPDSVLPHVGTYRRVLPVSLERMYENALDWEHLPFVHASSFAAIEALDFGAWGWRARVTDSRGDPLVIELVLDRRCRRWITRTLEGANAGSEIWTHAYPIARARVDIVVDFFVPGVVPPQRQKVGRAFAALYERLYDEDVAMMVERQRQLDRRVQGAGERLEPRVLGERADLALPRLIEWGGRDFVIADVEGRLVIYPAQCPHLLGPLHEATVQNGSVICPWHGYRFDVTTGECVSGQRCRWSERPEVVVESGTVTIRAQRSGSGADHSSDTLSDFTATILPPSS